jgi:hypothetical protein
MILMPTLFFVQMRTNLNKQLSPLGAVILAVLLSSDCSVAQDSSSVNAVRPVSVSYSNAHRADAFSSSSDDAAGGVSAAAGSIAPVPSGVVVPKGVRPFSTVGLDWHTGLGGVGLDVATPLARKFNVRAGADFFRFSTSFQDQGADVAINLHMLSGHASLDWFPFGGRFRLSPQVVFANNNRVQATALIPSGSSVTLNGQDYISSYSDPLHGNGLIDFHKISPGFSLGFGNIIPRTKSHFSIPVEAGFYYAGQPGLKVNFSGSACDPTLPGAIGCQSVAQDAGFQKNLAAFVARNNNTLSYASFFPIFSVGFGYKF